MFSSKTPRDLNHDPKPYRYNNSRDIRRALEDMPVNVVHYTRDPRPEFDHIQHNPPNPILAGARHPSEDWREWLAALNDPTEIFSWDADQDGDGDVRICTPDMIDHARRVLTRLAQIGASA